MPTAGFKFVLITKCLKDSKQFNLSGQAVVVKFKFKFLASYADLPLTSEGSSEGSGRAASCADCDAQIDGRSIHKAIQDSGIVERCLFRSRRVVACKRCL